MDGNFACKRDLILGGEKERPSNVQARPEDSSLALAGEIMPGTAINLFILFLCIFIAYIQASRCRETCQCGRVSAACPIISTDVIISQSCYFDSLQAPFTLQGCSSGV